MQRLSFLAGCILVLVAGCRFNSDGQNSAGLESCFDVGGGMLQCIKTPQGVTRTSMDVDHDGKLDAFVCANGTPGSHGEKEHGDDDHAGGSGGESEHGSAGAGGDGHEGSTAEKDDGEGDDDGDGVANHEDCDKMGCVVVSSGGSGGKDDGKEDDHAVGSESRASTLADDHAGHADGGDDHGEGEHSCDGGAHKGDDDHEHPRGSTMMCPPGGGTTPPPSMPPPSGGGGGGGSGSSGTGGAPAIP
jgi:hypothetical protein